MPEYLRLVESRPQSVHDNKHGNGNGGGDDMLERVKNLETKVTSLVTDVAVLKETVATKESLHKELNSQTWKIVVALVVAVCLAVFSKYFIK
ncbi:hypothetical protein NR352_24030 [Enterobacter soli]|uniref:hypothetical protein n=1 Tax=Enterobacter soli TaxID=885040 RepID=UPI0021493626|nr:hypothetical protein [Enterobacter soli]MCR1319998.1 hypothetical protein [Enterobacter soli]